MLPALSLSALPIAAADVCCTFCVALPARSSRPSARMYAGAKEPSAFFNALQRIKNSTGIHLFIVSSQQQRKTNGGNACMSCTAAMQGCRSRLESEADMHTSGRMAYQ
jgi:hypothetical protein